MQSRIEQLEKEVDLYRRMNARLSARIQVCYMVLGRAGLDSKKDDLVTRVMKAAASHEELRAQGPAAYRNRYK